MVYQLTEGFATVAAIAVTTTALAVGGYVAFSVTTQNESPNTDLNKAAQQSNYFTRNSATASQPNTNDKQDSPENSSDQRAASNSDSLSQKKHSTSSGSIPQCDSIDCINQKLSKCQQSIYKGAINLGPLGGQVETEYEILGRESEECRVKLVYLENPNENWEEKPLVCNYDTDKNIREASAGAMRTAMSSRQNSSCSGELLDTLPQPSVKTAPGVDLIDRSTSSNTIQSDNGWAEEIKESANKIVGPDGVYAEIVDWQLREGGFTDVNYSFKVGQETKGSECDVRTVFGAGSLSAPIDTTEYECQGSTYEIKFYGSNPESSKNVFEITKLQ